MVVEFLLICRVKAHKLAFLGLHASVVGDQIKEIIYF